MDNTSIPTMADCDPESEFLLSKRKIGNEWELFKENVKPLKRGRKVDVLNNALKSQVDAAARKSLLETRRRMIDAIDEYKGEDPLQPWIDCIKWVQESFPAGGDCSGLIVIYEHCVRTFWDDARYKDDQRYFKVWLEYAESCLDAEVIFRFLQANHIGQNNSAFYAAYALHMESKKKIQTADEIFNLGIARKAKPLKKLEAEYRKFLGRTLTRKQAVEDDLLDNNSHVRSFGTILVDKRNGRLPSENENNNKNRKPLGRIDNCESISVYSDENTDSSHPFVKSSEKDSSWQFLASRSSRNKENISAPMNWTSYKVPQNMSIRTDSTTSSSIRIEIFADSDSKMEPLTVAKGDRLTVLPLQKANNMNIKKETELLKENPLRYFPLNTLR